MFCKVGDYSKSKLKDTNYKQKTSLKSYNTEINIRANPKPLRFHKIKVKPSKMQDIPLFFQVKCTI